MKLNALHNKANVKTKKRVGRGVGSGRGKTSSRGIKGQKSRSGSAINGFEGGQQSVITSLPKRGFNSVCKRELQCFNVGDIQKLYIAKKINPGDVIDNKLLLSLKLIRSSRVKIKILGDGDLSVALTFKINFVSSSARNIIERAGGAIEV